MPRRPTKEFWKKVYPEVLKKYKSKKRARKITAGIWYHKLSPKAKRKFEKLRIIREAKI